MITQTRLPNGARHGVCWTFGVMNDMDSAAPSPSPGGATPAGPDTAGGGDRMVVLITAPLIHADGFNVEDVLVAGGMVVLHDGFDAGAVLRAVAEYRISRLILGTPQVYALAEHPDLADTDLSSVTELFYRGTTAVPRRLREARELFSPLLTQVYGTTEAGILAMLGPDEHGCVDGYGTVGRPLDPEGLSIRHPETGAALHAGEVGEICAKPRRPSAGYWLAPEPTAALVRGGWVRTGDSGRLDAGGYLHVNGRIADMITVNGVRIHPEAVEQVLGLAPGVSQAGVCGIEDPDGVERVYAVVVTESGAVVDLQELRRRVAEALSEEHVPSLIEIHRALPVTGWGKPDRVRLRGDARRRRPTEKAIATTA
jgi:fatty-acyl-CoA synthase